MVSVGNVKDIGISEARRTRHSYSQTRDSPANNTRKRNKRSYRKHNQPPKKSENPALSDNSDESVAISHQLETLPSANPNLALQSRASPSQSSRTQQGRQIDNSKFKTQRSTSYSHNKPSTLQGTAATSVLQNKPRSKPNDGASVSFENYPFGEIEVLKFCEITGRPLEGAHIRIQGFSPEGNPGGIPIDRTAITDSQGRILFTDLPAGNFTISEEFAPQGFILDSNPQSVSITWGQRNTVHFYNEPYTYLEALKLDGKTNEPLEGAIFMLKDPTTGEEWIATTGADGIAIIGQNQGSSGNFLIPNHTYLLVEIQSPAGYILDSTPRTVVLSGAACIFRRTGV